jgi:hypothetical protein
MTVGEWCRDGQFLVAMGVGLNVSNREPTTCINAALGCTDPTDDPVTSEALLAGDHPPSLPPKPIPACPSSVHYM